MPQHGLHASSVSEFPDLKLHYPKYRLKVLTGDVEVRLKTLIREIAEVRGMTVLALEAMLDHVHLSLETDPRWAPAEFVAKLKSNTSRVLRAEFAQLRSRMATLWSRSYFRSTVGAVSEATIRRYIDELKTR